MTAVRKPRSSLAGRLYSAPSVCTSLYYANIDIGQHYIRGGVWLANVASTDASMWVDISTYNECILIITDRMRVYYGYTCTGLYCATYMALLGSVGATYLPHYTTPHPRRMQSSCLPCSVFWALRCNCWLYKEWLEGMAFRFVTFVGFRCLNETNVSSVWLT
jgi:hypothetical protein